MLLDRQMLLLYRCHSHLYNLKIKKNSQNNIYTILNNFGILFNQNVTIPMGFTEEKYFLMNKIFNK